MNSFFANNIRTNTDTSFGFMKLTDNNLIGGSNLSVSVSASASSDEYFSVIFNRLYFGIIVIIFIYSLMKERNEFGCYGYFGIKKHCDELESVYLKDTRPFDTDTKEVLVSKVKSILSIHSKYAVWRKCFIIATTIIFFTKGLTPDIKPQTLIGLHMVTMSIIYFYHNFMNYHVYRVADNLGSVILNMILKQSTQSTHSTLLRQTTQSNKQIALKPSTSISPSDQQIGLLFSKKLKIKN